MILVRLANNEVQRTKPAKASVPRSSPLTSVLGGHHLRKPVNQTRRLAALAVVVLSTVSACGFIRDHRELQSLRKVGDAAEQAFRVYRRGTNAEGHQALVALATLLEAEEGEWRGTGHGKMLAFDLALTYARLGVLAEARGATAHATRYFATASEWYVKSGQARGEGALRTLVAGADRAGDRGLVESPSPSPRANGKEGAAQR